uniref:Uncharacterized protein n=1 Tax=Anopheles atroparvus TaxID=41427 RepID=A0A182IUN3_ANOAO
MRVSTADPTDIRHHELITTQAHKTIIIRLTFDGVLLGRDAELERVRGEVADGALGQVLGGAGTEGAHLVVGRPLDGEPSEQWELGLVVDLVDHADHRGLLLGGFVGKRNRPEGDHGQGGNQETTLNGHLVSPVGATSTETSSLLGLRCHTATPGNKLRFVSPIMDGGLIPWPNHVSKCEEVRCAGVWGLRKACKGLHNLGSWAPMKSGSLRAYGYWAEAAPVFDQPPALAPDDHPPPPTAAPPPTAPPELPPATFESRFRGEPPPAPPRNFWAANTAAITNATFETSRAFTASRATAPRKRGSSANSLPPRASTSGPSTFFSFLPAEWKRTGRDETSGVTRRGPHAFGWGAIGVFGVKCHRKRSVSGLAERVVDQGTTSVHTHKGNRAGDVLGGLLWQLERDRPGAEQALGGIDGQVEQGVRLLVGVGWQRADDFVLRDRLSGALGRDRWVSV